MSAHNSTTAAVAAAGDGGDGDGDNDDDGDDGDDGAEPWATRLSDLAFQNASNTVPAGIVDKSFKIRHSVSKSGGMGLVDKDDWVPSNAIRACMGCGGKFTMLMRKHHCRLCGQVFCNDCSPLRAAAAMHKDLRICHECTQWMEGTDYYGRQKNNNKKRHALTHVHARVRGSNLRLLPPALPLGIRCKYESTA